MSLASNLKRLVWRFENEPGRYSVEFVCDRFNDAVEFLVEDLKFRKEAIAGLRHRPTTLLRQYDEAINSASHTKAAQNFSIARQHIEQALKTSKRLSDFTVAGQTYMAAEIAYESLVEIARPEIVRQQMPSLRFIPQLLGQADNLIQEGEYRQARFMAKFCQRQADSFQLMEQNKGKENQLIKRRNAVIEIYQGIGQFAADNNLTRHFAKEAFPIIDQCLAEHLLHLMEHILQSLEVALAPANVFLRQYQTTFIDFEINGSTSKKLPDEVRQAALDGDWARATNQLLQSSFTFLSNNLTSINNDLAQVDALTLSESTAIS